MRTALLFAVAHIHEYVTQNDDRTMLCMGNVNSLWLSGEFFMSRCGGGVVGSGCSKCPSMFSNRQCRFSNVIEAQLQPANYDSPVLLMKCSLEFDTFFPMTGPLVTNPACHFYQCHLNVFPRRAIFSLTYSTCFIVTQVNGGVS